LEEKEGVAYPARNIDQLQKGLVEGDRRDVGNGDRRASLGKPVHEVNGPVEPTRINVQRRRAECEFDAPSRARFHKLAITELSLHFALRLSLRESRTNGPVAVAVAWICQEECCC
jgi:hypothetical protein